MEHVTVLARHDAPTPCRFAPHQPWHVCSRRDGAPLPDGETCWFEANAQAMSDPQKCQGCDGRYPDLTDHLGLQWHSGCVSDTSRGGDPPVSAFEAAARMAKARKLAEVLAAHGADSQSAERLPRRVRLQVADLAGCRPPSDTTWNVVIGLLQARDGFSTNAAA